MVAIEPILKFTMFGCHKYYLSIRLVFIVSVFTFSVDLKVVIWRTLLSYLLTATYLLYFFQKMITEQPFFYQNIFLEPISVVCENIHLS